MGSRSERATSWVDFSHVRENKSGRCRDCARCSKVSGLKGTCEGRGGRRHSVRLSDGCGDWTEREESE